MNLEKIDKIFHVADIHIRNYQRHDEYLQVFERLFDYISKNATSNSVIYLAGDIVHSKNDISPELINMVSQFFKGCADITHTILIAGNHDANLSNNNRLDSLSPIVNALNHPNIHYWKDSGVYEFGGISFSVCSVFSPPSEWVKADEIDSDYKVALYHGVVGSALTDSNYVVESENVSLQLFDGFDLVLLGDIHKRQFLNDGETVAYPSSLIQQNHSEHPFNHGIMVWDVDSKSCEVVDISNEYIYYTLIIEDGELKNDVEELQRLPKNLRLRVKYTNTPNSKIQEIVNEFKANHKVVELSTIDEGKKLSNKSNSNVALGDVMDIEYQNSLIVSCLDTLPNSEMLDYEYVKDLNRKLNSEIDLSSIENKASRNIIWKPVKFEFSNMFSYGVNNVIDFSNFSSVKGIFAPNATGKSTLLDSLLFCLFDKTSRTYKSSEVLNKNSEWFECKLTVQMGDDLYEIYRRGELNKKRGTVKVDVNFNKITDGVVESLNGEQRNDTNRIIRSYFGTYDDFLLTAFSTQNDDKNFIDKTQSERKELLNSFLGLSIFEKLYDVSNKSLSKIDTEYKLLSSEIELINYTEIEKRLKLNKSKVEELTSECNNLNNLSKELNNNIKNSYSKLKPISSEPIDIKDVMRYIEDTKKGLSVIESEKGKLLKEIERHKATLSDLKSELKDSDIEQLEVSRSEIKKMLSEVREKEDRVLSLKGDLKNLQSKVEILDRVEYDPNCKYCVNNPFLKDAIESKPKIDSINNEISNISSEVISIKMKAIRVQAVINEIEYLLNDIDEAESKVERLKSDASTKETQKQYKLERLENLNKMVKVYESNKIATQENDKIQESIKSMESEVDELTKKIQSITADINRIKFSIERDNSEIDRYNSLKSKLIDKETEYTHMRAYVSSVHKNGSPYLLLQKVTPVIEYEVNTILESICNFKFKIEPDGKNIPCYIEYQDRGTWVVELGSGMEKFILSIAIRVALSQVTSLSRPNFLSIDEGFGVLDSDNISSLSLLFDYLKSNFDFILCISHIDVLKDFTDSAINIHRNHLGYSEILNT